MFGASCRKSFIGSDGTSEVWPEVDRHLLYVGRAPDSFACTGSLESHYPMGCSGRLPICLRVPNAIGKHTSHQRWEAVRLFCVDERGAIRKTV